MLKLYTNTFIKIYLLLSVVDGNCCPWKSQAKFNYKFYLSKSHQRSAQPRLFVDNVDSLEACKILAREYRGLAFNYSSKERFLKQNQDGNILRAHFWLQPHLYFNCHILQCPENETFKTMINDTSFDYFSLYENPISIPEYSCLPEVGLFILHTIPQTFQNATLQCRHLQGNCGSLAHVASQKRTEALAGLMVNYNEQQVFQIKSKIYLAYIGLHYNSTFGHNFEFVNDGNENLKCYAYRAWEPGNPKLNSDFNNASCVALTLNRSWKLVKCERKLPFICEIWTTCVNNEKICNIIKQ